MFPDNIERSDGGGQQWTLVKHWWRAETEFHILRCDWSEEVKAIAPMLSNPYHCGYIIFPEKLPLSDDWIVDNIRVHGGVTFNEVLEDGRHQIGFDCNHFGDHDNPEVQNIEWLTHQCEGMATQIQYYMAILYANPLKTMITAYSRLQYAYEQTGNSYADTGYCPFCGVENYDAHMLDCIGDQVNLIIGYYSDQ